MRPLDRPCGEQGKQRTDQTFQSCQERDINHMSEEKQPGYTQKLGKWTEANIINPLAEAANMEFDPRLVEQIKESMRVKMLESFRNGQAAGPRPTGRAARDQAYFGGQPQRGGRYAYVR